MVRKDIHVYAGRWVACIRERVVAQGGTPGQALRAAQSRYKETPNISYVPLDKKLKFPDILDMVITHLPRGKPVYLVGGAVRDAILGHATRDLDFALASDAIKSARKVANSLKADFFPLDEKRDTGRLILTDNQGARTTMDFAAFRGPDMEADLEGRDFTLNAIAYDLSDESLHDPLGGMTDLAEKQLRMCSPESFRDDPVRILRGVRLAADFDLHILPETRSAMKKAAGMLDKTSPERLRDEFFKILAGKRPSACLRALDMLGALGRVLPEILAMKGVEQPAPHVKDVWEHSLSVVPHLEHLLALLAPVPDSDRAANLTDSLVSLRIGRYRREISEILDASLTAERSLRSLLFLAALLHDAAKPLTSKQDEQGQLRFWEHDRQGAEMIGRRARLLVLSNDEVERLEVIVRNHMRILFHANRLIKEGKSPTRRAVYRFFRDTGPAGVEICLLALADVQATYENTLTQETWTACLDVVRLLFEAWFEKREEQVSPRLLVDGNDLMKTFSLQPGPLVGQMLEVVREAQATGMVTTVEQAYSLVSDKLGTKE